VLISGHVNLRKMGIVTSPDGMMRIRSDRIVIPDVAYISFEHLPNGRIPHEHIPSLVPDLAVEILSDGNTREEMAIKLREYMGAGTRMVWYVDPRTRSVDVHRASQQVVHLTGSDMLSGGEVLPEFETSLAAIFDGG
jgi:Uma2 family endonuclease